jgi:hypothetical protein
MRNSLMLSSEQTENMFCESAKRVDAHRASGENAILPNLFETVCRKERFFSKQSEGLFSQPA